MKVYVSARGGDPRQLHVLKRKTSQHLLLKINIIGRQKNLRLYHEFKTVQTL